MATLAEVRRRYIVEVEAFGARPWFKALADWTEAGGSEQDFNELQAYYAGEILEESEEILPQVVDAEISTP